MTPITAHIPVIETDRLVLRGPEAGDLPAFTAFYQTDRSHMVGGPRDAVASFTSLDSCIGHWVIKGFGLWHLTLRETGEFIGWAGMIDAPGWDEPELGWTVLPQAEGKGLAYEAALAARTYAAQKLGLDGVISYIDPANTRSLALAARLGATFERDGALLGKPCHIYRHPKLKKKTA